METTPVNDELYQFLACDYFATGEGRTVSLLITRAYPHSDDYATHSTFTDAGYTPGTLKTGISAKTIAAREFAEKFGGWYLRCAENLPRDEFLKRFGHLLPEFAHNLLSAEGNDRPGNFNFAQQFHFNFS